MPQDLDANRFASKAVKSRLFFELYGRGVISASAKQCPNMNIEGPGALDLATSKPDGKPWNFLLSADRREAKELISTAKPHWVIRSPPRVTFWRLNDTLNYPEMSPAKVKRLEDDGKKMLHFAVPIAMAQLKARKLFLLEHPASASSWQDPWVQRRENMPGVTTDQCMFG